uniref:SUEL-type lectin domain-containing protein n=1 Tax=Parastrongyloides trichosuri TaxID=131310 RepID=A0A0N4ZD47_PARTI
MLEKFFIIVLSLNVLDATPSKKVYSGNYCYGDNYTVTLIGTLYCNGHPHNHSRVEVKRCDESGLACYNVFNVPIYDGNFNYTYQLDNIKGVDFSLWTYIHHKCCENQYKILRYEETEYKKLQDDNFKCGLNTKNVKNYGTINLQTTESNYYCYCKKYIVSISGKLQCFGKSLKNKTVDLMLCDRLGKFCQRVDTIEIKRNGNFTYSYDVPNIKKTDSTMKLYIYNECCTSYYETHYQNPLSVDVFKSTMACDNVLNAINFGTIDIKKIQCPQPPYIKVGRK